jgi:hypothetical protein
MSPETPCAIDFSQSQFRRPALWAGHRVRPGMKSVPEAVATGSQLVYPVATDSTPDHLAGRSNQIKTSATKHIAMITSAQKNEMKSL